MIIRRILAGAMIGGASGLMFGAVATEAFSATETLTHTQEITSNATLMGFEPLEQARNRILLVLPTLGGAALGAVVAISSELNMRAQVEQPTFQNRNYSE